jgi:hypothetical protein
MKLRKSISYAKETALHDGYDQVITVNVNDGSFSHMRKIDGMTISVGEVLLGEVVLETEKGVKTAKFVSRADKAKSKYLSEKSFYEYLVKKFDK